MKRYLASVLLITFCLGMVSAGPTTSVSLIGSGSDPIYTEADFIPQLFLNEEGRRVLFNQLYWQGPPGEDGDILLRDNNYIFTGEGIKWKVLVWDKNGIEKNGDTSAGWADQTNGPVVPETQVNCQIGEQLPDGANLAQNGYSNVRRPIDQEPQENFNAQTMEIYECILTVEPSCHGQKWFGAKTIDIDGNLGTLQEAESWFCNPSLDLEVSGHIDFGELGPGEQGASTFSVKNVAEANSGVEVVLSVSGKDFYDPASSGAKCPTSNKLDLQGDQTDFTHGFWYTAVQGSNSVGNKRIPYGDGTTLSDSDPIFSSSSQAQGWREWKQNELVPMSPGSEATLTLHLGLPQPCNGQFTDGRIDLFAWAI